MIFVNLYNCAYMDIPSPAHSGLISTSKYIEAKGKEKILGIFFKWNQLLKYLYLLKRKAIESEKKEK